jgi:sugar lactone lactonase YvrE
MSGRDYRQFKDLTRVWVSRANEVYLADNGNHRVMVFDEKMQKLHELSKWPLYRLRYPNGIDGTLDGRLAIADTGNHRVVILDAAKKIQQIIGKFGTSPGHLSRPMEARFGPNGDLYVLNAGNCRIDIFRAPRPFKQFPRCPLSKPPEKTEKLEDLLPPPSEEPLGQDSL